jgi:hypothetical protein
LGSCRCIQHPQFFTGAIVISASAEIAILSV